MMLAFCVLPILVGQKKLTLILQCSMRLTPRASIQKHSIWFWIILVIE